jgi:hypothetical protein
MTRPSRTALAAGFTFAAAVLAFAVAPPRAHAFPAFARKYGTSCTACHVGWPIFNQEGQNFRDNGYQLNLGKDDPVTHSPDYLPIAIRTTPAYQFTRMTNQVADEDRAVTTRSGGVPIPPGLDVLTGGLIAKDISFLAVVAGFGEDGSASLESAWARLDNLAGSGWLNLRIGKLELDQPASAHRNVTLTTGYAVYSAHPQGSVVGFDLAENQVGVELDGHDARSTTRYSLSFTSANGGEGLSSNGWSAPMVYGHVQRAYELPTGVLPWVRVGALGSAGWWPTRFDTLTGDDGVAQPIPGTGTDHKRFYRAGGELAWMMGHPSTPLFFTAAYLYGREDAGLAEDGAGANAFNGGFAEVDWVPFTVARYDATPWMFFGRYDVIRYRHGIGDFDGGTIGARRYIALGPRASAAIHLEGHLDRTTGVSPVPADTPLDVTTQSALAGIDFAF